MHIYPRSLTYFCYICAFDSQELPPCRYLVCYQWPQIIEERGWRRFTPLVYENICWPTSLCLQIWWLLREPFMILNDLLVYTFWSAYCTMLGFPLPSVTFSTPLLCDAQLQSSFLFELRSYRKSHLICHTSVFHLTKLPSKTCAYYYLLMQVYIIHCLKISFFHKHGSANIRGDGDHEWKSRSWRQEYFWARGIGCI